MDSHVITLTPEMAKDILTSRNHAGRPISRDRVKLWLTDMREGRWELNPQGISFSGDDITSYLVDGQHRLSAVVAFGEPVEFYAHFNVPEVVHKTMDVGLRRTAAQLIASEIPQRPDYKPQSSASRLSAAGRIVLEYGEGHSRPSNSLVYDYVLSHLEILDRYAPLTTNYKAGTAAAFAYAEMVGFRGVYEASRRLLDLDWGDEADPMKALAKALPSIRGQGALAQRTMFFTALVALEHVDKGTALAVARKYERLPKSTAGAIRTAA